MFNLEDLIGAEPDSHPLCCHYSEAKQTNLPELKEFEYNHDQDHIRDPFFDHAEQQPHSSTFSQLVE